MSLPSIGLGPTDSIYTETTYRSLWPDPVVGAHEVDPDYLGKDALVKLIYGVARHGWLTRVTHAQGSYPSTGKRPSTPRHSLAARMWRGKQRAIAVYVEGSGKTWSWDTLYVWTLGEFPTKLPAIGAFMDAVMGPVHRIDWPTDWTCPYFGPIHGPAKA